MPGAYGWEWNHITEKWEKAPAVVEPVRVIALGQAVLGACKLYWIACSPDAPGAEWEITDATETLQPIVYDHFDNDKHSDQLPISPPIPFTEGIWVEKFDHIHSLTFGIVQ
ncbi:unnamed protein product [marine sediment metagenome]|uniref:Uncharacterized protein n=1 Tax=marine sediment metagenome TaxID=412755 RepID=X1RLZ9_9ZZZZ